MDDLISKSHITNVQEIKRKIKIWLSQKDTLDKNNLKYFLSVKYSDEEVTDAIESLKINGYLTETDIFIIEKKRCVID